MIIELFPLCSDAKIIIYILAILSRYAIIVARIAIKNLKSG